jgi:hypothetical protein
MGSAGIPPAPRSSEVAESKVRRQKKGSPATERLQSPTLRTALAAGVLAEPPRFFSWLPSFVPLPNYFQCVGPC